METNEIWNSGCGVVRMGLVLVNVCRCVAMEVSVVAFVAHAEAPPLREDADGALRVGQTRVPLEIVLHAYNSGESPEVIVESYPTLDLADVYSVIAYHLRHPDAFTAYLERREREGEELQQYIEASQPELESLRARVRALRQPE